MPTLGGLTSHSSRHRFAARLNPGVRPMFSQRRYLWLTYRARVLVVVLVGGFVLAGSVYLISTRMDATTHTVTGIVKNAGHYPDAGVFTTASQLIVVSLGGKDVQLPVPKGCKLVRKGMVVSVQVTRYRNGSSDHQLLC